MTKTRTMLSGALLAGSLAAGFAGPAYAQGKGGPPADTPMQLEEKQKQKDAADIDQQYKSTLRRTRGSSTAAAPADDPWSNMRGTPDSKPKR